MTTTNPEQRARQILADRGRFPSGGEVPFDVVLRAMLAMRAEALEEAAKVAVQEPHDGAECLRAFRHAERQAIATAIRALSSSAQGEGA